MITERCAQSGCKHDREMYVLTWGEQDVDETDG